MSIVSLSKCFEADGITPKQNCFILTNSAGEPIYVDKPTFETILGGLIPGGKAGGQIIKGGTGAFDDLSFFPTAGNAGSTSFIRFGTGNNGTTEGFRVMNNGNIAFGALSVANTPAKVTIEKQAEQLRIGYDFLNYMSINVDVNGEVAIDAEGSGARFKFLDRVNIPTYTPVSSTDTGKLGDIAWDNDFFYICTATNTWKRTPLATW